MADIVNGLIVNIYESVSGKEMSQTGVSENFFLVEAWLQEPVVQSNELN